MKSICIVLLASLISLFCPAQQTEEVHLSELNVTAIKQDVLVPFVNSSMTGERIRINGKRYPTGISVHAPSKGNLYLGGKGIRFKAVVGVDDISNRRLNAARM